MHKVSAKRQITLPKELCEKVGILPGNHVEIFEHNGKLTVIKQISGISSGCLKHLKSDSTMSDEESLLDTVQ